MPCRGWNADNVPISMPALVILGALYLHFIGVLVDLLKEEIDGILFVLPDVESVEYWPKWIHIRPALSLFSWRFGFAPEVEQEFLM